MPNRLVVALLLISPTAAPAAPPTLTNLFPAGAERGKTTVVAAGGAQPSWPVQVWVSGGGVSAEATKNKGQLAFKVAADAEPGVRWVRLFNEEGASPLRPFVISALPEVAEAEPNDDFRKPQTLSTDPFVVNGRLAKSGDVDHFAVPLKKGQTLVAAVAANQALGSPMDGVLQLLSPEGPVVAENNDDVGLDPLVTFTAPKDGAYVARLFAFPAKPDSGIRFAGADTFIYRLTLTTGPFADHAFPLAASPKGESAVELFGWNIPDADRKHPLPAAKQSDRVWVHKTANPVPVRVERHATRAEAEPNGRGKPQSVEVPVTVSGRIDPPGDVDVYRFPAKKGQRVTFQVEGRRIGSPLDPVLRVADAAGKQLSEVDDTGRDADPETAFTAPADGDYQVEVRDLHRHGGWRYVYRLRALLPLPDFALTVAADQFTLPADKPLEIPVTVERREGFADPVEFKVEGLPGDLKAAFDPPSADAKAKAVKLKLTAAKGGFRGPIKVVGSAPKLPDPARLARAAVAGFKETTESIWLTVQPAAKK